METWYKIYLGCEQEPVADADTLNEAKHIAMRWWYKGFAVSIVKCKDFDEVGIIWRKI